MVRILKTVRLVIILALVMSLMMGATATVLADWQPDESVEITLQPDENNGKDAWVYEYNYLNWPNFNWGGYVNSTSGLRDSVAGRRERTYIEFDLSSLPGGVVIDSATLSMYQAGYNPSAPSTADYALYRVTASWIEGTLLGAVPTAGEITWNNQPAYDEAVAHGQMSINPTLAPQWLNFDITDMVRNWYDGTWTNNYGMVLRLVDEGSGSEISMRTSDYSVASERPKLVITYNVEGDPHKMHYPQLPDLTESGMDVYCVHPFQLADDFQCAESGWITDIHFWLSFIEDRYSECTEIVLYIFEDIPDPDGEGSDYSMPGAVRWWKVFYPGEYLVGPEIPTGQETFIHPDPEVTDTFNDNAVYQYNFQIDPGEVYQEKDEILWLGVWVSACEGGWKTSTDHFNDFAVWSYIDGTWEVIMDPAGAPMDLAFVITGYGADFGDAPDPTYPTLLINDGARHVSSGVHLGAAIDIDPDGQQHANALGDDINGDDEDGVNFTSPIWPGGTASVDVFLTSPTGDAKYLNAWLDFNIDGSWAGEQIFTNQVLTPGNNSLTFDVPTYASAGSTFARFRVDSTGGLSYTGMADDGEVEDYWVNIVEVDFGDAPDPTYPTLLASNGARHIVTEMFLGNRVDHDADGQPTTTADGDDTADLNDDEDGVTFTSPILPGSTASVDVFLTSPLGSGYLNAWMDFDIDGSWAGEQIFTNQVLSPGLNSLTFSVPSEALLGTTFTRFRVDPQGFLGDDEEVYGGEVEDYQVEIEELPPPAVGGEVYSVDKVALLVPWIALAVVIIAGGVFLIRRRVHS